MLRISEHFQYYTPESEHRNILLNTCAPEELEGFSLMNSYFNGDKERPCFAIAIDEASVRIDSSYYVGVGWLRPLNQPVLIESKVNTDHHKLDHLGMLTEALTEPENLNHLGDLIDIRFDEEWIEVEGDSILQLTPFLMAQFLMIVRNIVRKGLKKDYYRVTENLQSKVKGKVLVAQQIRQNMVRNRLTNTVCSYQEYGIDTATNRFLKHVLKFVKVQLYNQQDQGLKDTLGQHLNYSLGAFQRVSHQTFFKFEQQELNPLYKEYNVAIQLGNQILQLMDHDLSKASTVLQKYPPHWIDMSKLFELYVFKKLREQFPGYNEVQYHYKTDSQELDFVIRSNEFKAVVDAKYKPRYKSGNPSMDDARQLSGYARLNSVYKRLGITGDELIPVYFIYPKELTLPVEDTNTEDEFDSVDSVQSTALLPSSIRSSRAYRKMYLQEVELPVS